MLLWKPVHAKEKEGVDPGSDPKMPIADSIFSSPIFKGWGNHSPLDLIPNVW